MAAWIEAADRRAPLDLVIANAGIAGTQLPPGPERTRAIFAINLDGVLNTIEPARTVMLVRCRGQLALMSSLASFGSFPNAPAYCSSKAAVRILGESLRPRLAQSGIVVSVICPGFIATPMTADNRFVMPPGTRRCGHRARLGPRQSPDRLPNCHILGRSSARDAAPRAGRPARGAHTDQGMMLSSRFRAWAAAAPLAAAHRS